MSPTLAANEFSLTAADIPLLPQSSALMVPGPVTITYQYDKLNRLTAADYSNSNSDYYHYTYDAAGNRKTQSSMINRLPFTTSYNYDNANRILDVNGVPYNYDYNGNLKNDGVNNYQYDKENRLISFSNSTTSATYQYNGLGDRLKETVGSNTTTFTMELNAGLTQTLSDGTNTYIYGVDRIAQNQGGITEYFLGDVLGSVRQLADAQGDITLAKSYAPYGETLSSIGNATSPFAYTGEQQDASGLTYLRTRYYASGIGRFLTRDTGGGNANSPMFYNKWNYVNGNPINFSDPTGLFSVNQLIESFGLSSVDQLVAAFDTGQYIPGAKGKWAWLKLLMDAREGDQTTYGAAILLPPLVDLMRPDIFQTVNGKITIGGTNLRIYADSKLDKRMNWIFPYRNAKPTHFILNGNQYIDGNRPRDLPDFRIVSLDITPAILSLVGAAPFAVCGKGITGGPSGVIDRFGNTYAIAFGGVQLSCLGYISVGEGYVARKFSDINWNRPRVVNEEQIQETITGGCVNAGAQVIVGGSGSICLNKATSATWFYTPGAGDLYMAHLVLNYRINDLIWLGTM